MDNYLEKVASYEDDILYDLTEDDAYDLACEKIAATRYKELMNDDALSKKSVKRLDTLGYLDPRSRPRPGRRDDPLIGLSSDYGYKDVLKKKGLFKRVIEQEKFPIRVFERGVKDGRDYEAVNGHSANPRGDVWQRLNKLNKAKSRNANMVTNRWFWELANSNKPGASDINEILKRRRETFNQW